jgi:hypothetical protein
MSKPKALLRSLALACALSLPSAACGGSHADLPTIATPPPEAVRSLTFLLVPAKGEAPPIGPTNDAIQSALIAAEYKITTDPEDPHDATIVVKASAAEEQSFMTVQVNGKRRIDYKVNVNLTVKDGGAIVDQRSNEFEAGGGEVDRGNGLAIVNDLTDSMRFRRWARKAHDKQLEEGASSAEPAASASPDAGEGD